jgi:hypothetical protein
LISADQTTLLGDGCQGKGEFTNLGQGQSGGRGVQRFGLS